MGPTQGSERPGFRLDLRQEAMQETESGLLAIAPGQPEKSEVVRRILSRDSEEVMPPPESKLKLTESEKATLPPMDRPGGALRSALVVPAPPGDTRFRSERRQPPEK